jgi:hypothetical protein
MNACRDSNLLTAYDTNIKLKSNSAEGTLSERFEKTYISVSEFISSWEKEIYELNNLDYFSFLLINYLGNQIENEFFKDKRQTPYLRIEPEDIGTLAFNIGDSFESFLEHNCFGDCKLSCPTKLNEKMDPAAVNLDGHHLHILQVINSDDIDKRQFLMTDILNYVVLDTLFDFYNYEIGLDLDDADAGLMHFADFITTILEKFIETKGQQYLSCYRESAVPLFEKLMQDTNDNWEEEAFNQTEEEDPEDQEQWKLGDLTIEHCIDAYLEQLEARDGDLKSAPHNLSYLKVYANDYAGIKQMDELNREDQEEFFLYWLLREIALEIKISPRQIRQDYLRFFKWLEITYDVDVVSDYQDLMRRNFEVLQKSIILTRKYFERNSIIDSILEVNDYEGELVDGLLILDHIQNNGLLCLTDLRRQNKYMNVQINFSFISDIPPGSIMDIVLKPTRFGWRVINLEYIFPAAAKPYLH